MMLPLYRCSFRLSRKEKGRKMTALPVSAALRNAGREAERIDIFDFCDIIRYAGERETRSGKSEKRIQDAAQNEPKGSF